MGRARFSSALQPRGKCIRQPTLHCNRADGISLTKPKSAVTGLAEPCRVREHCLEYWLQLAWRAADHAEHFRGCRLLLQQFTQLRRALSQLVQQPGVLDRDDRLGSEVRDQRDLLLGEWARLAAIDRHHADRLTRFEHRNCKQCPDTEEINGAKE